MSTEAETRTETTPEFTPEAVFALGQEIVPLLTQLDPILREQILQASANVVRDPALANRLGAGFIGGVLGPVDASLQRTVGQEGLSPDAVSQLQETLRGGAGRGAQALRNQSANIVEGVRSFVDPRFAPAIQRGITTDTRSTSTPSDLDVALQVLSVAAGIGGAAA